MQGFCHKHLSTRPIADWVPEQVLRQFQDVYRHTLAKQMFFRSELKRILTAMNESSIDVLLMKGAALVDDVYDGDIGIRPMADLDMLIKPEQLGDAERVAKELGYIPTVDELEQEKMRTEDRQLASLYVPGRPVILEIHTHLVEARNPMRFDIEQLWAGGEEVTVAGQRALILTPEYAVATLAVNFMKDRRFYSYSSLGQLTDVAETIRASEDRIDWSVLAREPIFESLRGVTFCALYLAKNLLGAAVPNSVVHELAPVDFQLADMTRFVDQRVFGKTWFARGLGNGAGHFRWRNLPRLLMTRFFSNGADVEDIANEVSASNIGNAGSFRHRLWGAVILGASFALNPSKLYRDIATDKWLHSMYHTSEYSGPRDGRKLAKK